MSASKQQNKWHKLTITLFAVAVVLSILAELVISMRYNDDGIRLLPNTAEDLVDGWYYIDERGERVDVNIIPGDYPAPGGTLAFRNTLTAEEVGRGILMFNNIRQNVNVYADGSLIYSMGRTDDTVPTSVNGYRVVGLPESDEGYEIIIEFRMCRGDMAHIDAVSVCTPSEAFVRLLSLDLSSICLAFFAVFASVLLVVFSFIVLIKKFRFPRLYCLTYLLLCLSTWLVLNLWSSALYPFSPQLVTQMNYSAFFMLPIAIGLYSYFSTKHFKSKAIAVAISVCSVILVGQLILSVTNAVPLYSMLTFTHIALFVMTVLALWAQIVDYRIEKNVQGRLLIASFAVPPVVSLVSIISYRFSSDGFYTNVFVVGMVLFASLLIISTMYSVGEELKGVRSAQTELEVYHTLSIKDGLTGLGNRRAFDIALEHIEESKPSNALLFFMDLNNLKTVNDTYGHAVGDELIKGGARCVSGAFSMYGSCFRLGGDEFAVLIENPSEDLVYYYSNLEEHIASYNMGRTVILSMAKGASYLYDSDHIKRAQSLWKSIADRDMYADKMRMKMFVDRSEAIDIQGEDVDALTGILNPEGFRKTALKIVFENPDENYVLWYLDIKKFKFINDFFGYEIGDRILQYWGRITLETIMEGECCGRVGGDKLAVLAKNNGNIGLNEYFDFVAHSLAKFFDDSEMEYQLELSGGVYQLRAEDMRAPNISRMLDWANVAHRSVSNINGSHFSIFNDSMWQTQWREQYINQTLRKSIDKGEITIWLQPQYNYMTGKIVGAEALCRWTHAELGWLSPGEFIPALEKTGQITVLDNYIWEEAFKLSQKWKLSDDFVDVPISVNISRVDVMESHFIKKLRDLCEKYEVSSDAVHLEITESAYMDHPEMLIDVVSALHNQGFVVEMDDFGSGFSSLNMLKEVPVDRLKLDIRFIRGDLGQSRTATIVSSIIKMADELGMRVIAEGIETRQQAQYVSGMGCQTMQGYYFSKPVPVSEFEALLNNEKQVIEKEMDTSDGDIQAQAMWNHFNTMAEQNIVDGSVDTMYRGEVEPILFSEFQISAKNGVIVLIDENFEKITGYGWNDIRETELREIDMIPEEERPIWWTELFKQMSVKSEMCVKHTLIRKNGSRCVVTCYGKPHLDEETGESRSIIRMAMVRELD